MSAFALVSAAALAAGASGCAGGLCQIDVLDPWFRKLARIKRVEGERPLHILQIGDSHTAGDTITGAWRDRLQARYGAGGRGVLAAGRPYQGYRTQGATVEMSAGWKVAALFGPGSAAPRPPIGLSGFSTTSTQDGATMALTADAGQMFDRFVICAAVARDAGTLSIRLGDIEEEMRLASYSPRPECKTIATDQPQFRVEVTAGGGPVTITSWGTFRDNGGIALSNVGIVGSQLQHFARADDAVLAEEFRAYRPDLVIVAFGTNEGFSPIFRPAEYEITLRTQIGRLRRLLPNVPVMLIGAPDALTRRSEMAANAPGPVPRPCLEPVAQPDQPQQTLIRPDAPLDDLMADIRQETAPPPPPAMAIKPGNPLFPPAGLAAVRAVQRRIAQSLHVAYWDWESRMGGACSAVMHVKGAVPLMRGDYVHFNSAGGRMVAERLDQDMEAARAIVGGL